MLYDYVQKINLYYVSHNVISFYPLKITIFIRNFARLNYTQSYADAQ